MSFTPESWARDLLTRMGYPINANNVTSVLAWEYAEGGHFHNDAKYNPLNTTMDHSKYGTINSAGVASYPDYDTGMKETIATLKLPAYAKVRADLKAGAPPATTTAAVSASPWGTWHGTSTAPLVARARHDVHEHPSWAKPTGHDPHPHKPAPKHTHKHQGHAGGSTKVVLDLAELQGLSTTYRNASDRVLQTVRAVNDIAYDLTPALAALPADVANAIRTNFQWAVDPQVGFGQDARLMDDLSAYCDKVHRLAEEADADNNGKWTKGEGLAFARKHPKDGKDDPALQAVLAALGGGTIIRRGKNDDGRHAFGSKSWQQHQKDEAARREKQQQDKAAHQRGQDQHHDDKHHADPKHDNPHPRSTSDRAHKIDKMIALANKQHAVEHNGDNRTKYGAWFGNNGSPWCADFVSYVFAHSGNPLPAIQGPHGFAYVPYAINYARAHHQLHLTPHKGDIFLLKDGEHTGIVTHVNADGTFDTVEGNYGDQVAHNHRNAHDGSYYFWTAIQ